MRVRQLRQAAEQVHREKFNKIVAREVSHGELHIGIDAGYRCESVNLTVKNFVDLNWFGEKKLKELEGEELIEVEEFKEAVTELRKQRRRRQRSRR